MGQGLGQRPRDDGARALHAAAPRRDAAAVRARRDERRGHGRPPRALPDRPGGAARVDRDAAARVRPGRRTSTTRTPTAINVLAGTRDGERARRASASATRPRGSRTSGPASRSPSRSARRCAPTPALKLVVLAKHGLVVWGDTAEEAYRRTIEVINRAADFVNARDGGRRRGSAARPTARRSTTTSARRCCARCCRRCAARCRASAPKVLVVDTSPRVLEFVSLARRAGADRRRRRVPGPPRPHQARAAVDPVRPGDRGRGDAARADPRARGGVPRRLPRLRRAPRRRDDRARRPGRARRADPARRPRRRRADAEERAAVARPLPPRDRGDGRRARARRLHVARRGRELRRRVLAARALQALARAAAGRAAGHGRARHRRGGRHRPRGRRRARRRRARASSRSTSTATARTTRSPSSATRARPSRGDVTSEDSVRRRRSRAAVDAFGGVDIVVSNAGRRVERGDRGDDARRVAAQPRDPRHRLLPRRARGVRRPARARAAAARSCSSRRRTRSSPARTRPPTRRRRRPSCTSRAAWPRRAARPGSASNTVNPDAVLQGSRIWDSSWREERAAAYGIDPDELEEHYRQRTTLGVNILPEDIAEAVLHFASPRRSGKSTGNVLNVDGGVPAAYPR